MSGSTPSPPALWETPDPEEKHCQFLLHLVLVPHEQNWQLTVFSPEPCTIVTKPKYFPIITKNGNNKKIPIHTASTRFSCKASSAWNCHSTGNKYSRTTPPAQLQTSQWSLSSSTLCCRLGNECHQYCIDFENLTLVHWMENRTATSPQATKQWIPRKPLLLSKPASSLCTRFRVQRVRKAVTQLLQELRGRTNVKTC